MRWSPSARPARCGGFPSARARSPPAPMASRRRPPLLSFRPQHLAAAWRMESFDGQAVPAAYAIFHDVPVGDRVVARVEIRLDSATKAMTSTATYERRYWFTELHDNVVAFKYMWGDHGRFVLGGTIPVPLTLTSEYIQNLMTPGSVRSDGRLALNEELWIGETRRATLWVRRPGP